ncbi:MAG: PadR family transcriptional regulator [Candidatus Hermodarchaeota archaeon]
MAFCGTGRIDTSEGSISQVQLILLALLNRGPAHGYRVLQGLRGKLGGWRLKSGTVYPALHRMAEKGLISSKRVLQDDRPDAVEYYLTPKGKKVLHEAIGNLRSGFKVQDHFWRFLGTSMNGKAQDDLIEWSVQEQSPMAFVAMKMQCDCEPGHCTPRHLRFFKKYRKYLERELEWVEQRLDELKSSDESE